MRRKYPFLLSTLIVFAVLIGTVIWTIFLPRSVDAKVKTSIPQAISTSFQPTTIPNDGSIVTLESTTFTSTVVASVAVWSNETALIGNCCGGGGQPFANLICNINIDRVSIMTRNHIWDYTSDDGFDITGSMTVPAGTHTFTLTCSSTLGTISLESGGTTIAYAG
jgi:hypothetical protein